MAKKTEKPATPAPQILDATSIDTDLDVALVQSSVGLIHTLFGSVSNAVAFFGVARTLDRKAQENEEIARTFRVTNVETDTRCVALLRDSRELEKTIDDHWDITGKVYTLWKRLVARRDDAKTRAKNAVGMLTRTHAAYEDAEARRIEQERREQEERDRRAEEERRANEKLKAELDASAAEEGLEGLTARERLFCEQMADHGDQVRAAKAAQFPEPSKKAAALMKLPKINRGIEAAETARNIRIQAEADARRPIQTTSTYEPPAERTTAKATTSYVWSAEVVDEAALITAILTAYRNGGTTPPRDLLTIRQGALTQYAKQLQDGINQWPGVRAKKTPVTK